MGTQVANAFNALQCVRYMDGLDGRRVQFRWTPVFVCVCVCCLISIASFSRVCTADNCGLGACGPGREHFDTVFFGEKEKGRKGKDTFARRIGASKSYHTPAPTLSRPRPVKDCGRLFRLQFGPSSRISLSLAEVVMGAVICDGETGCSSNTREGNGITPDVKCANVAF